MASAYQCIPISRPTGLPRQALLIILATNDDGVYAPGLWASVQALREVGDVVVAAPDREQSGVGTAITLNNPVHVREVMPLIEGVRAYAVEGTPADSTILGVESLVGEKIDLVVSGINPGANMGNDVFISGTVGAALQAFFRGIPAIAVSVTALKDVHFHPGRKCNPSDRPRGQQRLPCPSPSPEHKRAQRAPGKA